MSSQWRTTLKLATKLPLLPGSATFQVHRHASRKTVFWNSKNHSDSFCKQGASTMSAEHDQDEVEAELDSILRQEKNRQKATKFNIIKRKMRDPGPPQRTLTWEAIEQIRYLKQEFPEEWTLARLADGFSVSTDVISRVLHSKFVTPLARKLKQDQRAYHNIEQQCLTVGGTDPSRLHRSLPPGPVERMSSEKPTALTLVVKDMETGLVPSDGHMTPTPLSIRQKARPDLVGEPAADTHMAVNHHINPEEKWDGETFTDEELLYFAKTMKKKPSPVKQEGRDFFDTHGNFLYRI
ncbi:hypothetical protein DNTS_010321 [Danionella cerebrum]|uniref:Neugrin n=1 Tax=Danionella cerebrum TaxID=2873325 RepID=A0A553RFM4_9TELE|nr:hypothetical protein DNTS_010321 [Danionella translucida]